MRHARVRSCEPATIQRGLLNADARRSSCYRAFLIHVHLWRAHYLVSMFTRSLTHCACHYSAACAACRSVNEHVAAISLRLAMFTPDFH